MQHAAADRPQAPGGSQRRGRRPGRIGVRDVLPPLARRDELAFQFTLVILKETGLLTRVPLLGGADQLAPRHNPIPNS